RYGARGELQHRVACAPSIARRGAARVSPRPGDHGDRSSTPKDGRGPYAGTCGLRTQARLPGRRADSHHRTDGLGKRIEYEDITQWRPASRSTRTGFAKRMGAPGRIPVSDFRLAPGRLHDVPDTRRLREGS